ncbi:MAG: serine/threonine protein kinase [Gammaproteobacteria bacterium]|nr:serine/threonine protein kinase [Gammaproteobacteria bacterium]
MAPLPPNLPENTVLDRYRIGRVLGGGGFSVVYMATDLENNQPVAIKEYFPAKLARRAQNGFDVIARDEKTEKMFKQGRKLFFQEASLLAALDHPNIVKILGFFQANETVYTAMLYQKGISLQAYLKKKGGKRSENFILTVFNPFLECVQEVHEHGLLHLDIKPGNIFIRNDASPLLLDFGAAHKLMMSAESRLFPVVSHGFSPIEQTQKHAHLGPWTDIYAIGATMRSCIEGRPPIAAKKRRPEDLLPPAALMFEDEYSPQLLHAIDWAMELQPENRPQSIAEFRKVFPRIEN